MNFSRYKIELWEIPIALREAGIDAQLIDIHRYLRLFTNK